MEDHAEDIVWTTISPNDIWIMDKLILSRKMGYICGPTGMDVPKAGTYIVRPCVNMLGLGMGAEKLYIEEETMHLPLGFFWCEFFKGRHVSVDYHNGKQVLAVEGFKKENTFTHWDDWRIVDDKISLPSIIEDIKHKYEWINCEYIGGKLIEIHLRRNTDFIGVNEHFIPVWEGQDTTPPLGYTYREYPDIHGRIGAFTK